jgi:acyl carrier protein
MTDIKEQVRTYVVDNFVMGSHAPKFADSDSFLDLHIVDSTGFLELVTYIEEKFGIRIEDDEMVPENLDSLDNIDAYVAKKLNNS